MDIDYTKMNSGEMLQACGTDAMRWAEAFIQFRNKHDFVIDESLMLGWFANAIEAMRPVTLTDEEATGIAARIWCRPETSHITMDPALAKAFADVLQNGEDKSTLKEA